jgi:hypothetical protein
MYCLLIAIRCFCDYKYNARLNITKLRAADSAGPLLVFASGVAGPLLALGTELELGALLEEGAALGPSDKGAAGL